MKVSDRREIIKQIVQYIADNTEPESSLLYPCPEWTINPHHLLTFISEVSEVDKVDISNWVSEVAYRKEEDAETK